MHADTCRFSSVNLCLSQMFIWTLYCSHPNTALTTKVSTLEIAEKEAYTLEQDFLNVNSGFAEIALQVLIVIAHKHWPPLICNYAAILTDVVTKQTDSSHAENLFSLPSTPFTVVLSLVLFFVKILINAYWHMLMGQEETKYGNWKGKGLFLTFCKRTILLSEN